MSVAVVESSGCSSCESFLPHADDECSRADAPSLLTTNPYSGSSGSQHKVNVGLFSTNEGLFLIAAYAFHASLILGCKFCATLWIFNVDLNIVFEYKMQPPILAP